MRGDVMLSPHYHGGPKHAEAARDFGIFTAGYIWSDNPEAPKVWRGNICRGKSFCFLSKRE